METGRRVESRLENGECESGVLTGKRKVESGIDGGGVWRVDGAESTVWRMGNGVWREWSVESGVEQRPESGEWRVDRGE